MVHYLVFVIFLSSLLTYVTSLSPPLSTLTASRYRYNQSAPVTFYFTHTNATEASSQDWIGLYLKGTNPSPNKFSKWMYAGCTVDSVTQMCRGSVVLSSSLEPGLYTAHYMAADEFLILASVEIQVCSGVCTVNGSVAATQQTYTAMAGIIVNFELPADGTPPDVLDWISIYPASRLDANNAITGFIDCETKPIASVRTCGISFDADTSAASVQQETSSCVRTYIQGSVIFFGVKMAPGQYYVVYFSGSKAKASGGANCTHVLAWSPTPFTVLDPNRFSTVVANSAQASTALLDVSIKLMYITSSITIPSAQGYGSRDLIVTCAQNVRITWAVTWSNFNTLGIVNCTIIGYVVVTTAYGLSLHNVFVLGKPLNMDQYTLSFSGIIPHYSFVNVTIENVSPGGCLSMSTMSVANVFLRNVTFRNGIHSDGGGMSLNYATHVAIIDSSFESCGSTTKGGGLMIGGVTRVLLQRTVFRNCAARGEGGCMYLNKGVFMSIVESRFSQCSSGSHGGAVYALGYDEKPWWGGSLTVTRTTFENCWSAVSAGCMSTSYHVVDIQGSVFTNCTTSGYGGGISTVYNYQWSTAYFIVGLYLTDTRFTMCMSARDGGGLYAYYVRVHVSESQFVQCASSLSGGGIYVESGGWLSVVNCGFDLCMSANSGGSVCVNASRSKISNSFFLYSTSRSFGGAVSIINCSLSTLVGGALYPE
eukprot:PhF_6_TR11687/c1_g1_i9/m.18965